MKFLSLIWGNLFRKKTRTVLTVLSIFVAFVLFGLLSIINEAFSAGVTMAGRDRLIVRHKVSFIMTLPQTYRARIEAIEGVDAVADWTWFNGIYQDDPKNFFGSFPVDPERFLNVHTEFELPPEQKKAWLSTRTGAIIGPDLAKRLHKKVGDRIPLTSPIWPRAGEAAWEFEIVGIYNPVKKTADPGAFFFRYDYFDEGRTEDKKGQMGWFMVRVKDADRADEIASKIDTEFANSPYETKAEPEGAFAQGFVDQIGNIGAILLAVLSAVFFTILLVAGNTMAQSVRERTQEIGVLKSMGFTNELVLVLVLAESCVIAVLGGLAGLAMAWVMTLGGSPVPTMLPIFYLPARAIYIGIGLVLGLGLVAGIFPALQAMRLQVAVALRRHA